MRFPPSLLDEIRARLPASQVIGRRVKLKRQGREFAGLSPFKHEKTPSFTVNDQKGFYHCFASGEHGDIFAFLMKTEGLDFPEAVERLAGEAGVEMPKSTPQAEAREALTVRLRKVVEASCVFFQERCAAPPAAMRAPISNGAASPPPTLTASASAMLRKAAINSRNIWRQKASPRTTWRPPAC